MSFGGNKYSKLRDNEAQEPFLNEDTSKLSDSEEGSSSSHGKLSKRQKAVLISFIAITLVVVVTVSVVLTQRKDLLGSTETRITRSDRRFTLDEVMNGMFSYDSYSTQWVSDQNYLHSTSYSGALVQYNMDTMDQTEIISVVEMRESKLSRVKLISPDKKWFLFANNTKSLYRHSFYGDYYVKNLETGAIKAIKTPDTGDNEQIRYCGWSTKGNAMVFVYKCNIYYVDSVADDQMVYFEITKDGIPKKVFNGVPDWVYEEEIIATTNAIEFSSDGKYMAYVTFNATDVPFFKFPRYGAPSNLYTTIEKIAYPKAGYPNPTVKLSVIDIGLVVGHKNTTRVRLQPPTEITVGEYYYAVMQWSPNNKIFVQWMNRAQNETYCYLYEPHNPVGVSMESHKTLDGWIDDDYVKPSFSKDGTYYITMLPKNVPGKGNFRHLAKVTMGSTSGSTDFLTEGDFTVQDISCYDEDNGVVYFRSTEASTRHRHVYSIDAKTKEKKCVSCGLIKDSDGTDCTYYYPTFSKQCSWVTLMCQGPFVPITNMYGLKNDKKLILLTSNNSTKMHLAEKDVPVNIYYTVKTDDGKYDIHVKETRPANLKENKKYAVLFDVYGGPNTQKVTDKYGIGIDDYFVGHDIIVVTFDARGTGYYGYNYLYAVYRKLGYYESVDAITVAKYLQKQSYVDPDRIAIWGWSYGGFYAATTLAMAGDVINTAVSVAPVTDWRYYDTVYSERYMGFPSKEDNLKGYEDTAVMARAKDFAGKNFLLIHGTADDNVHFQNSAQLVSALIREKIKFRSQFYPDRDHGIQSDGHIYYLLADYILAHLKEGRTAGKYYGFGYDK